MPLRPYPDFLPDCPARGYAPQFCVLYFSGHRDWPRVGHPTQTETVTRHKLSVAAVQREVTFLFFTALESRKLKTWSDQQPP